MAAAALRWEIAANADNLQDLRSTIGAGDPQDIARAAVIEIARHDEKMVGKAVQIAQGDRIDSFVLTQPADQTFGSTTDSPCNMKMGGRRRTSRQDERVERCQFPIHGIDLTLEPFDLRVGDPQATVIVPPTAEIGTQIEQVVLDARQYSIGTLIDMKADNADHGIQFVDRPVSLDPRRMLGDPTAVAKRCTALIAAACIDLC